MLTLATEQLQQHDLLQNFCNVIPSLFVREPADSCLEMDNSIKPVDCVD